MKVEFSYAWISFEEYLCNCNPTNKYNRKVSPCAGNIDETVRRIHHTLEWRRNFNVDSFSKFDETSTLGKVMHPTFLGLASPLGSPVAYLPLGQIDFKGKSHSRSTHTQNKK